jgi:glycerol 3-phosphatase-2
VIADAYDAFLFDLDGVLYRGTDRVPHAAASLARLRTLGKRVAFVTNNSASTPEAVAAKLRAAGIDAQSQEVETSALATAALLAGRHIGSAFVVGEEGILDALTIVGIRVVSDPAEGADAVVVGFDRGADYAKLRSACVLVQDGAVLVATNADASFPAGDGHVWPGAGALLSVIETTTGARAEVVGKPQAPILEGALARAGGGTPLLIGDRLDTDIAGAHALGWDSLLVLTGIATLEELARSPIAPTHVGADLRALFTSPAV